MSLETRFREAFTESIELKGRVLETQGPQVAAAAEMLAQVFKAGGQGADFRERRVTPRTPSTWPRSSSTGSRWSGRPWPPWP